MNFYSSISEQYDAIFPLNITQVSFIKSYLNKDTENIKLLDIGCGTGSLSIELFGLFDKISAIDTNKQMLESAKKKAAEKNIDFINIGMLDIENSFTENSFDIISCFGNTIVHLPSIEAIELFFENIKAVLKPDGKFLCQIINYDNVLDNNLKGLPTIENNIIKFERFYSLDNSGMINFSTILTIKKTGKVLENNIKLFPLRKKILENALQNAGFNTVNFYGSFTKKEYNNKSLPLVFECF